MSADVLRPMQGLGSTHVERRRHPRVALKGTALVMSGEHAQRARIANLSEGGLLATTLVTAPMRLLGRTVDLEVRLDAGNAKWMHLSGRIARIGAERIAIAFESPPSSFVRVAAEMIAASRRRQSQLAVVLIDLDMNRRMLIAEELQRADCTVIQAGSALEAIVRLGEASFEPDLIVIARSCGDAAGDMRRFVAGHHQTVRVLTISDELAHPAELARVQELLALRSEA